MRQTILLAGLAAVVAASPAAQVINFSSVNAGPSLSFTGPPVASNTQEIPYNSSLVAAEGFAATTSVTSTSATAS